MPVASQNRGNQERQGVEDAAAEGHQRADHAAEDRTAAARHAAVVGEGLGEAHADARPDRRRQADQKSLPTCRAGPVIVAKAAANSGASVETEPSIRPASPGWITWSTKSCRATRASSSFSLSGWRSGSSAAEAISCRRSASARSPSSCRSSASLVDSAAAAVESLRLQFHQRHLPPHALHVPRLDRDERVAADEALDVLAADQRNFLAVAAAKELRPARCRCPSSSRRIACSSSAARG